MSYQGLARRYRPTTFDQIVGQDTVTRALSNAVKMGQVGQQYLFVGPSGVGKTTTARVLAAALGAEPPFDLEEIDCASHRGIDAIREICWLRMWLAPHGGKARVFVLDECHQLSDAAFSALLKPLEEPPRHTVMILVTTDIEKIPVTIRTRCQRFDFQTMAFDVVRAEAQRILVAENIPFDPDRLRSIAIAARGSMRTALQLLDSEIVYGGGKVGDIAIRWIK